MPRRVPIDDTPQSHFGLTVPSEPEAICLRNKGPAEGRDDATWRGHGKEKQRSAAGKASGIDGTVRPKWL